jgi:hypothetical protein
MARWSERSKRAHAIHQRCQPDRPASGEGTHLPHGRNRPIMRADAPKGPSIGPEQEAIIRNAARTPLQRIVYPLLRYSDLRPGEAISLRNAEVDQVRHEIRVMAARTCGRTIPLLPELEEPIAEWRAHCTKRGIHRPDGPFLVKRNGDPLQRSDVFLIVRDLSTRAGITCSDGSRVTPQLPPAVICARVAEQRRTT